MRLSEVIMWMGRECPRVRGNQPGCGRVEVGRGQLEQMEDGGLESTDGSLHPDVSPHGVPGRRGVAPRDHLEPAPSGQPTRTCLFLSHGFQERKRLCLITVPGSCLSLGGHQKQRESPRETPHGPLTTGEDGLDFDLRRKALPLLPEAETVGCTEGGKEPGTGRGAGGPAHLQPTSAFRGPAGPWLCAARPGRCPSRTHSPRPPPLSQKRCPSLPRSGSGSLW